MLDDISDFIDSLQKVPCNHCQGSDNKEKCNELVLGHNCPVINSPINDLEDPCSCCQGFCNKEKCDELILGYRCPVLNVIQSLELGFENAVEKASEWLKDFCNEHYIMSYTDSSEVVYEKLIEIFKSKMEENK